jgi:hypothetical protein
LGDRPSKQAQREIAPIAIESSQTIKSVLVPLETERELSFLPFRICPMRTGVHSLEMVGEPFHLVIHCAPFLHRRRLPPLTF